MFEKRTLLRSVELSEDRWTHSPQPHGFSRLLHLHHPVTQIRHDLRHPRTWSEVPDVKSYPLKVHEKVGLMAYQTVLPGKSVYVGLTITLGMTQVTEIGQEVLNTLAAYSPTRDLSMFQLVGGPKNPLKRFRAALGQLKDGDAIVVMAEEDGLSGPIIKALNIQTVQANLPHKYALNEESSLIQGMIEDFLAAEGGKGPVKRGMAPKTLAA